MADSDEPSPGSRPCIVPEHTSTLKVGYLDRGIRFGIIQKNPSLEATSRHTVLIKKIGNDRRPVLDVREQGHQPSACRRGINGSHVSPLFPPRTISFAVNFIKRTRCAPAHQASVWIRMCHSAAHSLSSLSADWAQNN